MDFLQNLSDWLSYNIEAIGESINAISYNIDLIAKIVFYAPYIAAALGIVLFIQFVIICSIKMHMSKLEEKLDKILKSSEAEKKESENGENAK